MTDPSKAPSLAALLAARREAIVARFVESVRRLDVTAGASRPALVDHIPGFLDEVIEALQAHAAPTLEPQGDLLATAREHGAQREALGYDLESLIREYGILQRAILQDARQAALPLTLDEFEQLATRMSMAAAEAAAAYTERHAVSVDGVGRVEICRGEVQLGAMSVELVTHEERARGIVLACRAAPRSDVKLRVLGSKRLAGGGSD